MSRPPVDDPGVALDDYRQHGAGVGLTCLDCMLLRILPLEAVITRLPQRGVGDGGTGVRAVARYVRGACPRCGGKRFESRPAFPGGKAAA